MKFNGIGKLSLTALLVSSAISANAGIVSIDGERGKFSIDGDVEFDINYQNHKSDDIADAENDFQLDQTGRILFDFKGERTINGYTFKSKVSPGYGADGGLFVDDVWFAIASNEGGEFKIGHFEAYDLFPAGQDTFLDHYADSGDGVVSDSQPYMYRAKEARGRGDNGQLMYSHSFDNLYVEVAVKIGDGTDIFDDGQYHGKNVQSGNDVFIVRPVVAYQAGNFKVAAGLEKNLVSDSAVITVNGKQVDILDRTGYGVTGNYSDGDFYVNLSYSAMDAVDEENVTYGISAGYAGFGLGYIAAENEISAIETGGTFVGDVEVSSIYASYKFSNVFDVEDFSIYVGGYQSTAKEKNVTMGVGQYNVDGEDDKGLRMRLKYFF
ncbi:carbohydrate porin [Vibrio sp. 2-Bac 85]